MAEGSGEPPPHPLHSSVIPSASVWFPLCHQSPGEESYHKPFGFTHTGYIADTACAHMGECDIRINDHS